jgi:hypothetical protein
MSSQQRTVEQAELLKAAELENAAHTIRDYALSILDCNRSDILNNALILARHYLATRKDDEGIADPIYARPRDEYHEDYGDVLWVKFPIEEPPYVGSPLWIDWPGYHTHWIPLPDCNRIVPAT